MNARKVNNIIERELMFKIKPFLERKEFISIIGPRQAGKTTFLDLVKDYLIKNLNITKEYIFYITFEDRKLLNQFESDAKIFINSYLSLVPKDETLFLMIDEFQYAKDGGQKLKLIYDTMPNVKIFITGSSSLDIKANVGKFMVGRILNFNLYLFNFREYLSAKDERLEKIYIETNEKIKKMIFEEQIFEPKNGEDIFYGEFKNLFEDFAVWGGYPQIVLTQNEIERKKILSEIYNNYVLKDIKTLLELATERNLFLLSEHLAAQTGNILVYQNLSKVSGLDYRNLKKHLNILYETFVCKELRPFYQNKIKELSKSPKIFFMDNGFRNNLVENTGELNKRQDSGALVENVVFTRLNELMDGEEKLNFWRTKSGAEVDFILRAKEEIIPIEVKFSDFSAPQVSKSFMSFIYDYSPKRGFILTKNYFGFLKKGNCDIIFIPVYYL